jgi:hypothetical protein
VKRIYLSLAIQLVLLAALSAFSRYGFPDFSDANWSTVLFLTPWGIAYNHLAPSAITTFYSDPARGQATASFLPLTLVYLLLLTNAVFFRRSREKP